MWSDRKKRCILLVDEKIRDSKELFNEIVRRLNEDRRRIKLAEHKMDRLESSMSALETAAITQMGDLKLMLDQINMKMDSVSSRLNKMETDITRLKKIISKGATKLELKQLESFIDLINPITSRFVTKDELDRTLDDKLTKNAKRVRV